ncbi:hypothetical protein WJX81_004723 [Elliptochloris bilobata]|uniref:Conserved oligomeric Golgi complex subunit 1 n=1 Tax=Elliptochloris bilobata TaxID=381761 RepID=A0AAW1S808_9CHLO
MAVSSYRSGSMGSAPLSPRMTASEAGKNAERLFETQTVLEIREVETKTRRDIEEKRNQLRQLVGNSYRDLISSADTIMQMAQCCDRVCENVRQMQAAFAGLEEAVAGEQSFPGARTEKSEQRKALYALGGRIRYLVDTPEMIWGCLDTGRLLDGALRLLRAREVHRRLRTGRQGAEVAARFPLLVPLWPGVEKFRDQIVSRVETRLRDSRELHAPSAANALAASAFLQDLTSAQALEQFLAARRAWVGARLAAAGCAGELSSAAAARVLSEVAAQLQAAVCTAGELVLERPAEETEFGAAAAAPRPALQPLLPACAADDSASAGELLFGPLPQDGRGEGGSEAEAWQVLASTITARLTPLPAQDAAAAVGAWLAGAAQEVAGTGGALLAACRSADELASAEAILRASIAGWRPALPPPPDESELLSPARGSAGDAAAAAAAAALEGRSEGGAGVRGAPATWEGVCQWVLGRHVSLWDTVFEAAFLQRAQEVVDASFRAVVEEAAAPLDACLAAARAAEPAPVGGYTTQRWPEENSDPAGVDARLRRALADALLLLEPAGAAGSQHGTGQAPQRSGSHGQSGAYSLSGRRGGPPAPGSRAAALAAYVQDQAAVAAEGLARALEARLAALPPADPARIPGVPGAAAAEQALLIGRLATILGGPDTALRDVLGPPEAWRAAQDRAPQEGGAAAVRISGGRPAAPAPAAGANFQALQEQFRRVALRAHGAWAAWAARALGGQLGEALRSDAALMSPHPLRGWEETVVAQEDELGGEGEEMRFALPAAPSPAALLFLLAAGRELARAGGHLVPPPALALFEWELGAAGLSAITDALQLGTALDRGLTEKGVLQLLLDVRFLRDALAGGRPAPPDFGPPRAPPLGASGSAAELAAQKRAYADLETSLQDRLDPIDWATYEPYLWANEAAFCRRSAVLFGALTRLSTSPPQALAKPTAGAEANIMAVAPPAARFPYLPISMPLAHGAGGRGSRALKADAKSALAVDRTGNFSFANIGAVRGDPAEERAADAATFSTFEALQSKLAREGGRLGVFGALIGDKAAEVTALAQQSFGEMALPSALQQALGGSGGSASTLISTLRGFQARE